MAGNIGIKIDFGDEIKVLGIIRIKIDFVNETKVLRIIGIRIKVVFVNEKKVRDYDWDYRECEINSFNFQPGRGLCDSLKYDPTRLSVVF